MRSFGPRHVHARAAPGRPAAEAAESGRAFARLAGRRGSGQGGADAGTIFWFEVLSSGTRSRGLGLVCLTGVRQTCLEIDSRALV
jgi:hypothetical protein